MQVIFCCICPHFEPLRAPRKLPLKSSGLPNEGQKFLFESPSKSAKTITAVPLKKLVPPRAHFMVVLAHCCDMLNPNTPTDMEVASALDMKCKVFFMEGIFVVFQWHQFNQNLSVSSLKLRWSHRSRLGPSDDSVWVTFLGGVKCGPLTGYKNLPIMAVTFGSKGKDTAGCHGTDTREFKHDNCAMSGLQKKIICVVWMSSEGCDIFRLMLSSAEQSNFRTCKRPFFQKTPLVVQCLHTHTHFEGTMLTVWDSKSYSCNCRVIKHNAD